MKVGDEVLIIVIEDGVLIKKKRKANLRKLRGLLANKINYEKALETLKALRKKWKLETEWHFQYALSIKSSSRYY